VILEEDAFSRKAQKFAYSRRKNNKKRVNVIQTDHSNIYISKINEEIKINFENEVNDLNQD